ncbi:MAG TPA: hypothetical protein PKN96_07870, partial [Flavobacterium sp.]|uniref:hypothetical protein n=1 Tax=Flavobacterium sp. TaxID=239 RepID=UPI002C85F4C2
MKKTIFLLACMISNVITASNLTSTNLQTYAQSAKSVALEKNNLLSALPTVVVNMNTTYNNLPLPSFSTAVSAQGYTYPGTTNIKYRFAITNITTNTSVPDFIQTSRFVNIPTAIQSYNCQYTIKASAVIDDVVYAYAGNTITVLSPTIPLITLSPVTCETTLANLTSTLVANPGFTNATSYTFRIKLTSDTSGTYGYSTSSSRFVGANTFVGFPLLYGTRYNVAVQYTFPDPLTGLPVDSGYGGECMIETPKFPLISLASPLCGSKVDNLTAPIVAEPGPYATMYQFRIKKTDTGDGSAPIYYYSPVLNTRFTTLAIFAAPLAYDSSYSISVRYCISSTIRGTWSGFGHDCIILTPTAPTTKMAEIAFKAV